MTTNWFALLPLRSRLGLAVLGATTAALVTAATTLALTRALIDGPAAAIAVIVMAAVALAIAASVHLVAPGLERTVLAPVQQLTDDVRASDRADATLSSGQYVQPEIRGLAEALSDLLAGVSLDYRQLILTVDELRAELRARDRALAESDALVARERDANRLKDAFLSSASHELRTPINAIAGWVHVLGSIRADDPTFARGLATISRNVQSLVRVVSELVDVSRLVTGTMELTFDLVDLRAPIHAALEGVTAAAQAKHIVLDVHLPPTPCYITGDRPRLQHVVGTLLSNAVRFTQTGGVVSVVLTRDGEEYRVDIVDTGIGVAQDSVPRSLEGFHEFDGLMTRDHAGMSLGLAVVRELAQLHGGSVRASADGPDDGSAIAIRLPALADIRLPGPADVRRHTPRADA